jgi:L-cysteate sulfo-lyase
MLFRLNSISSFAGFVMTTALDNALGKFPRLSLFTAPTPVQRLMRLERCLGDACRGVKIFVKRDDHMELGGGGNKLRKLEYHLGAAEAEQVDTVITVGGVQSNHARLTAAASAKLGLTCELILTRAVPRIADDYEDNGNILLDDLFGAHVRILPGGADSLGAAEARAQELRSTGRKVRVIPSGGSTPLGALGYARCALEIAEQERQLGERFRRVIVANGGSGTHAGLSAGFSMLGRGANLVRSFAVLGEVGPTTQKTSQLLRETLSLLGTAPVTEGDGDVDVSGAYRGDGYGIPTSEMIEAARMLAANEGLLVDPVYSGKALAGLIGDIRSGLYAPDDSVLFVMTGGTPSFYVYRSVFR